MSFREEPFFFECEGERLPGIATFSESTVDIGVLIIVGGPQYRVGSHRQFVLLARAIANASIPSMRFDFRGAGDATGEQHTYEDIDADIRAAIAVFFARLPQLKRVVLWGLCGAASAALLYAYRDPRVAGLVLVNPWVRTEEGIARTYLRHYYLRRLVDKQLWRKVLAGDFDFVDSAKSLTSMVRSAISGRRRSAVADGAIVQADAIDRSLPLPARMAFGMAHFAGDVLIVLSGTDYTALEFRTAVTGNEQWQEALARNRVVWHEIAAANHTFATREWRDEATSVTLRWLLELVRQRS